MMPHPERAFFGWQLWSRTELLLAMEIEDWATHIIEHGLSGLYNVPHGAGLSLASA
jgi:alcohol dehydrogenase YqhD (iron-dependent ADH family)